MTKQGSKLRPVLCDEFLPDVTGASADVSSEQGVFVTAVEPRRLHLRRFSHVGFRIPLFSLFFFFLFFYCCKSYIIKIKNKYEELSSYDEYRLTFRRHSTTLEVLTV